MIWVEEIGRDYKELTLREVVGWMKRETEVHEEPLDGERLGMLTIGEIVEKARQYKE